MEKLTDREIEIISRCIINQMQNNSRAKQLAADEEINTILSNRNKELQNLLEKINS